MPHEKSFMETIIPRVVRKTKHKIEQQEDWRGGLATIKPRKETQPKQ